MSSSFRGLLLLLALLGCDDDADVLYALTGEAAHEATFTRNASIVACDRAEVQLSESVFCGFVDDDCARHEGGTALAPATDVDDLTRTYVGSGPRFEVRIVDQPGVYDVCTRADGCSEEQPRTRWHCTELSVTP